MGKTKKERPGRSLIPATEGTMADLIGNSVDIKLPDGDSVIVPTEKAGNRVANMILAAQIRHLIQNSIKTYKDKEMLPTPKDLKDLAEAAKSLHQFSGEVYKEDEGGTPTPKKLDKPTASDSDINFDDALNVGGEKPNQ